jgi:ribosomal protein S19
LSNSKNLANTAVILRSASYFKNIKNLPILPSFVGLTLSLYNGKIFIKLAIKESMVGFKFGDFIISKKTPVYFNKKKKKKRK